jgi:nitrate/TMAO reductase-like tetraheme cytochrome c subunit
MGWGALGSFNLPVAGATLLVLAIPIACSQVRGTRRDVPSFRASSSHRLGASSAETCRTCHQKQYREWANSRHRQAFTNAIFQRGFRRDPHQRCLVCHLPLEAQRSAFYESEETALIGEGVTCLGCHSAAQDNASDVAAEPKSCGTCHQFRFLGRSEFAQATVKEWEFYRRAGGTKSCVDCHLQEGGHRFAGAHDVEVLGRALRITTERGPDNLIVTLENVGAGHDVPTGDVFRLIRVEARQESDREFAVAAEIGRNPFFGYVDGGPQLRWRNDNALKPFEARAISLPLHGLKSVRVVYAYETELPGFDAASHDELAHTVLLQSDVTD